MSCLSLIHTRLFHRNPNSGEDAHELMKIRMKLQDGLTPVCSFRVLLASLLHGFL